MSTPAPTPADTRPPLDVDAIRHLLEERLQERLDFLGELAPRALPTVDPVAYQTAVLNRRVVEQITAALNRLDAGTYGRCAGCGCDIPPARLEVLPHAAACVDCQARADTA